MSKVDAGAYRFLFPILFVWGCYVTTFMPHWEDRATHLKSAHVVTGEVVSVQYHGYRGACRVYLRYGDDRGLVGIALASTRCAAVGPERFVGQPLSAARFRTGGLSDVVVGDEHLYQFDRQRIVYNVISMFFAWGPLGIALIPFYHRWRRLTDENLPKSSR